MQKKTRKNTQKKSKKMPKSFPIAGNVSSKPGGYTERRNVKIDLNE